MSSKSHSTALASASASVALASKHARQYLPNELRFSAAAVSRQTNGAKKHYGRAIRIREYHLPDRLPRPGIDLRLPASQVDVL